MELPNGLVDDHKLLVFPRIEDVACVGDPVLVGHVVTGSVTGVSQSDAEGSNSHHFFGCSEAKGCRVKPSLLKTSPVKLKELLGPNVENELSAA